jgi:small subunit ribosomal protein S6
VIAEVESLIEAGDGQIVGNHDWGQRRMTFEIDHREEAEYRLYQFEGGRELLERLQSRLRITDGLLRFRIIKTKAGLPVPPPPDQQGARRRDERDETDTRVAARAAADAPPQ